MNHINSLAAALTAAVLALGGCSSKESRVASGLQKAAEFVKVGDWDKASVEVRNVLQVEPKTARAHYVAGQIAEGQRDPRRALGHFLKAVELQPGDAEAQVAVARIYLLAGDVPRADGAITAVLARSPQDVGALTIRAAMAARGGRNDEALTRATELVDRNQPVPIDAAMLAAGLLANAGRRDDALAMVDKALSDHPKHVGLLQIAAQLAVTPGSATPAKARQYLERAVAQAPKSFELRRSWAQFHLQRNEVDEAEKVLRDAVAAEPSDTSRQITLLDMLAARRGTAVAEKAYLAAVEAAPREAALRFAMARFYEATRRADDAQRVLRDIVALEAAAPAGLQAQGELARYRLAAGRVGEARTMVAGVLQANPRDNEALLLRAQLHLLDGNARDAVTDLRAVARDQPDSPTVIGLLAHAHRQAGEPTLARDVVGEAVKLKANDAPLRLMLAADLADAKDMAAAQAQIDEAIRIDPRVPRAYELRARLALAAGDTGAAARAYTAMKAAIPDQPIGALQLGKLWTDQRKFDAALKEYDAAIVRFPGDPALYAASVALLAAQKKHEAALVRIAARQKGDPRNPLHEQLRGDVARERGDLVAAEKAYEAMLVLAPGATSGYTSLAGIKARRQGVDAALAVLERGEAANPTEVFLPLARAEWLGRSQRDAEAITLYEAILKRFPDADIAANNLSYLLARTKRDAASLDRALQLAERFAESANPAYLDSLGYVYFRRSEYTKAVPVLERALRLSPQSTGIALNLGKALVKSGNGERGKALIRQAIDSKKALPDAEEAKALLAAG